MLNPPQKMNIRYTVSYVNGRIILGAPQYKNANTVAKMPQGGFRLAGEDRGVIEVPIDNPTVIYQDTEGQYYEIDVDELLEYDDDKEITYGTKSKSNKNGRRMQKFSTHQQNIMKNHLVRIR